MKLQVLKSGRRVEVGNSFCPTGKGGGVDPTCGKGSKGGSGGSSSNKTHSQDLPKNPKKLNLATVQKALGEMGFKLGAGKTDMDRGVTVYELTQPNGSKSTASIDEIRTLLYRNVKDKKKQI